MTGRKEPVCYQGTIYKSFTDACKQLKVPYRTFINIRYKNPMLSVEEMLTMALKVVKAKRKYKSPATRCSTGRSYQKAETGERNKKRENDVTVPSEYSGIVEAHSGEREYIN